MYHCIYVFNATKKLKDIISKQIKWRPGRFETDTAVVFMYMMFLYAVNIFLFKCRLVPVLLGEQTICRSDAAWYKTVATEGYKWVDYAFFPMFPLLWHLSHLGNLGISILNGLLFGLGFATLNRIYRLTNEQKILYLCLPPLYFCFVPYSESLFFLEASLLLYGIYDKKSLLIIGSLIFLSLTRATAAFLLPGLLLSEVFCAEPGLLWPALKRFIWQYLLPLMAGTFLFFYIEYLFSHKWFLFFEAQVYWGHKFSLPVFPLFSIGGDTTLWLSALAFFIGVVALLLVGRVVFLRYFKHVIPDRLLIISFVYLLMCLVEVLMFNPPVWATTTVMTGIFRYQMVSPFFFVFFVHYVCSQRVYSGKIILQLFVLANVCWLAFGSYRHIVEVLYFNFGFLIVLGFLLVGQGKFRWVYLPLAAICFLLQVHLFQLYMSGLFPD